MGSYLPVAAAPPVLIAAPPPPPIPLKELENTEVPVDPVVEVLAVTVPVITVSPAVSPDVITVSVSEEIPTSTGTSTSLPLTKVLA
jgi:hypothetical protein